MNDKETEQILEFEELLATCKNALERFVYYKMNCKQDGEDVLQEVYLSAYKRFEQLRDQTRFKAWILSIAHNKCNDFYRSRERILEIPIEEFITYEKTMTKMGMDIKEVVHETLSDLGDKEKEILYLYYIQNERQQDIAQQLGVPLGTVKSRLHKAKEAFKTNYPYAPVMKGEDKMMLPIMMPEVSVVYKGQEVFDVVCEEGFGSFIIPRVGEKCEYAFYSYPEKKMTCRMSAEAVREAVISGIKCVEIEHTEYNEQDEKIWESVEYSRLTDETRQYVAEWHIEKGMKKFSTFLDENFIEQFGWGEDNAGFPTHLKKDAALWLDEEEIRCTKEKAIGVVGRYEVIVGGKSYDAKSYDAIRYVLVEAGVLAEKYVDQHGRTILWRCYNKDDWKVEKGEKTWTEQLPDNRVIHVNGEKYVHWYDRIADYVL